jgi:hypothetical protein
MASQPQGCPIRVAFRFRKCDGNTVAEFLASLGIFIGTGSASSAAARRPPQSLLEMGGDYAQALAAVRVSLSRYTQGSEISCLLEKLPEARNRASKCLGDSSASSYTNCTLTGATNLPPSGIIILRVIGATAGNRRDGGESGDL